jgi:GntR family transcriptional repressor for pyruvate dehydrogenase complex
MTAEPDLHLAESRLSRAAALAREIEGDISAGIVTTGERLGTKEDLRQRFGVAMATVNEAVKLLDARGLVEARSGPGGGIFAASPAARMRRGPLIMGFEWVKATLPEYRQVRWALEPLVYREAASHHTASDIRALDTIVDRMHAHRSDLRSYLSDNTAFHRSVATMVDNVPLRSIYVTLLDFFEDAVMRVDELQVITQENIDVHRDLVVAIDGGAGRELEAAIEHHNRQMLAQGMFDSAANDPD